MGNPITQTHPELTPEQELLALCQMMGVKLERCDHSLVGGNGWTITFSENVWMYDDFAREGQPNFYDWHVFKTTESALKALRGMPYAPRPKRE